MANGYVGVPMSYTPVEYIESTGTQYIDTGFKPNPKIRVVLSCQTTNLTTGQDRLFGILSDNNLSFQFYVNGSMYYAYSFQDNSGNFISTNKSLVNNSTLDIDFDANLRTLTMSGAQTYSTSLSSYSFTNTSTIPMILFGVNANGTIGYFSKIKLFSCQIYDDNVLVRDYIPVLDSSNIPCLFDLVENKFYYNAGSGTFTAGNTTGQPVSVGDRARKIASGYVGISMGYTPIEYIESTGTQYIDTGIVPTSTTKLEFDANVVSGDSNVWMPVYGSRSFNSSATYFCLYIQTSSHHLSPNYAGFDPGTSGNTTINFNQRYKLTEDKGQFYIDDVLKSGISTTNTLTTGDKPIYLFANNSNGTVQMRGQDIKLYGCKIWNNNILVRDFIAVQDDNSVPCLYDLVEGKFYYNKGSGSFTAGSATGQPVSLGSRARKIIRGYVGVNGLARLAFGSFYPRYKTTITDTVHVSVPAAASTNDYFLIAGGITSGSTPIKTVTAFSNSLVATQAPDMAYQSWYLGSTSFNNHAIFLGGKTASSGSSRTNQCLAYSNNLTKTTLSNLWTSVYEATSASNSTHFIVAGGCSYSAWETSARAYDTNFTLSYPSSLSGRSAACQAASVGDYIIFNADYNGTNATTCYDNTNVRSTIANPYGKKVQYCLGLSTNSYAVFFGGSTGGNTSTAFKDCKAYDENKVITSFDSPSALFQAQGFSTGDYAVVCCDNLTLIYDDNLVLVDENTENSFGHSYDRLGATMGSKGFIKPDGSPLVRIFDI